MIEITIGKEVRRLAQSLIGEEAHRGFVPDGHEVTVHSTKATKLESVIKMRETVDSADVPIEIKPTRR